MSDMKNYLIVAFSLVLLFSIFGILNESFKDFREKAEDTTGAAVEETTLSTPSQAVINRIIAVALSPEFQTNGISFGTISTLPSTDTNAIGNNYGTGTTTYYLEIDPTSTNVDIDFCIKASDNLDTIPASSTPIPLLGYTWTNNTIPPPGDMLNPPDPAQSMSLRTDYEASQEGVSHLSPNNFIYYRFYLDIPGPTDPGTYQNIVFFKVKATDYDPSLPVDCGL